MALPNRSDEEHRLLRNDGDLAPQVIQADLRNIDPVDDNGAASQLHQPEQGDTQGGLPCGRKKKNASF